MKARATAEQTTSGGRSRDRLRLILTLVLSLVAGTTLGILVIPRTAAPGDPAPEPTRILLMAEALSRGDEAVDQALNKMDDYLERTFSVTIPGAPSLALSLRKWGAAVEEERLRTNILDAKDASSPTRRLWARQGMAGDLSLPCPISLDTETALTHLLSLKHRVDRKPRDARYDFANERIEPEVIGRWLDLDATLSAMVSAIEKGELKTQAVISEQAPKRTAQQLAGLSFSSVLGHFETKYSRSQKYADRTFNLKLAAKKLDGTVLLPGEEFDFNQVVGARDEAAGYKVATVIADGELVDGIGGGTCQISGTLHGAAFFAGLEIVERYPHTRPSSYIKMGMDATVVYPTINFRFRNSFDFPVALHQTVEDGTVRAEVLGPAQDQVVTLIRKIDSVIPYDQLERKDPSMPRGQAVLAQRGVPGFRLHRYRTVRRGSHTLRERWRDIYPPTPQVIRVGTGSADLKKKSGVDTPEYRADEVLILTQRRPMDGKPGEFAENRQPGKYGKLGWTKEAGMPLWDAAR